MFFIISVLLVLVFRWVPIPFSSFMVQAKFNDFSEEIHYSWVSYEKIAPNLVLAAIASEDQKFPNHYGVDLSAISNAFKRNWRSSRTLYGGSTISQQTAKNLFLWPGKSYVRKGIELYFTFLIELLWSKQRIIEVYLNVAQFGEHTFGVKAASQKYLKTKPNNVSKSNAARMMVLLPNPRESRFYNPNQTTQRKVQHILTQMRQLGGTAYIKEL